MDLLHRGEGGHVDLSQLEAMAAQVGPALVEASTARPATPGPLPRVFRTRGDDQWIAIGPASPQRLAAVLGAAGGLDEAIAGGLDEAIAGQDAEALAARLQEQGIAAYPVRDGRALVERDA